MLFRSKEVITGNWFQTYPNEPNYHVVTLTDSDAGKDVAGLAFGNAQYARLTVKKFYDYNKNGLWDEDVAKEVELDGWKVNISGATGDQFTPYTVLLLPGEYSVTEYMPIEDCWLATADTTFPITLAAGEDRTIVFGNVCVPREDGRTIGFWTNKNGQALILDSHVSMFNDVPFFKNKWYDFGKFKDKTAIANYFKNANAEDMKYMLSAQTIAMMLNVNKNFVSANACVLAPGVVGVDDDDVITVGALIKAAEEALKNGNRQSQEAVKNALDNANNNLKIGRAHV